jgi:thiol-disulfide isomerase/thioredoxin
MKKFNLSFLMVILLLLAGCQEDVKDASKDPVENVTPDKPTEHVSTVPPGTLSQADYDYSKVVNEEKAKFYTTNEILLGDETKQKEEKYWVYFYSPECVYCDQFFDTLVEYEKTENAYPIYKMNVDLKENINAWGKFEIQGTPTLMLFNTVDKKIEDQIVGLTNLETIPLKGSSATK